MTLNGFPYGELSFGADGLPVDPSQRNTPPPVALDPNVTDLLVLAHGWNDDVPKARALYDGLTAAMVRAGGSPPGLAVLGIFWPAKQFDAEPGTAAALAADPGQRAAFVQSIRSQVTQAPVASWADPGDEQDTFFGMDPEALFDCFGSVEDGVAGILNLATFYEMKARSGLVGQGLAPVLAAVRTAQPYQRLHLCGHSFGARAVASAMAVSTPLPISSGTLIQGAFSHYGFARKWDGIHDGLFRPALLNDRVTGPIVVTYSRHDVEVGLAYALASRLADQPDSALGPIGGPHDPFGAIGANGALATPESVWQAMMGAGTGAYALIAGAVNNLESSAYIPSHFDVAATEVGMAIVAALNTNEIGTTEAG